mgnify:CR=1 FL=1
MLLNDELEKRGFPPAPCWAECPPGWKPLVCDLLDKLRGKCTIAQIKEKFGELRVYVDPIPGIDEDGLFLFEQEVNEAINEATIASNKICEVCGAPGKRYSDGWSAVYCEPHWQERLEERRRYGKRS